MNKVDRDLEMELEEARGIVYPKPLYVLMEKLLNEDENTDETLVSSENLTAILKTDFNIPFDDLSEAEAESYMNVLKWSLKSWPGWEKLLNEEIGTQQTKMHKYYLSVKKYINLHLQIAEKCITLIEQESDSESDISEIVETDRLVLKVECSKKDLKTLINSKISKKLQLVNLLPSKVNEDLNRYKSMSFMDIFNWPYLEVHINLPDFSFVHKNISESTYRIVDLKTSQDKEYEMLDRDVYCNSTSTKKFGCTLDFLIDYLDQVIKYVSDSRRMINTSKIDLMGLFQEIKKDILPLNTHITFGTEYKYNLSSYNYVQYLSNTVNTSTLLGDDLYKKYSNIQPRLQHIIKPIITFCLSKFTSTYTTNSKAEKNFNVGLKLVDVNKWLSIHCALCKVSITGFSSFLELNTHLAEFHGTENEWLCVKCKKVFTILELAYRRWNHSCP